MVNGIFYDLITSFWQSSSEMPYNNNFKYTIVLQISRSSMAVHIMLPEVTSVFRGMVCSLCKYVVVLSPFHKELQLLKNGSTLIFYQKPTTQGCSTVNFELETSVHNVNDNKINRGNRRQYSYKLAALHRFKVCYKAMV